MGEILTIPLPGQPMSGGSPRDGDRARRPALGHFLAGPENRLVGVAVRRVLEDALDGYNPLVLYGPSGTGKSHLARGLAAQWKARYRRRRVVYTTAVDFARELKDAIDSQATEDFRTRYRQAGLLVFEDLGRLATKPTAQEELIHTLDALLAAGRPIVVTAAAPPVELPGILPALRSRLLGGLTVSLRLPGPETRLTIVQHLAGLLEIRLSPSVTRILAEGLAVSVPELLGAMVQLQMSSRLGNGAVDAEAARRLIAARNVPQPSVHEITTQTARYFALKLAEVRGPSRRRAIVAARDVAMYLARQLTSESLHRIGQYFGGRDHTTVMHGCAKTEHSLRTDPSVRQAVEQLQRKWQSQ